MKNAITRIKGGMDSAVTNTSGLKSSWMMILIHIALIGFSMTNCDTTLEQTQPDNPTKPVIDGISTANNDLEFGEINTNWTQDEVNVRVRMAMNFLASQAQGISIQYSMWRNELAPTLNYLNESTVRPQLSFADGIRNNEDTINYALSKSQPIDSARDIANSAVTDIKGRILNTTSSAADDTSLSVTVNAFVTANRMHTRKYASSEEQANNQALLERWAGDVRQYCGYSISTTNLNATIETLKPKLLALTANKRTGPPAERGVFVRQFEDLSQFVGWLEDLKALGYDCELVIPLQNVTHAQVTQKCLSPKSSGVSSRGVRYR